MRNPCEVGRMLSDCIVELPHEEVVMAAQHPPRFLKIVNDAKMRVRETTVDAVKKKIDAREKFALVDVREESEFAAGRLQQAKWLGKGIIERDIESVVPDPETEIVLYCGGGFRSALAADNHRSEAW